MTVLVLQHQESVDGGNVLDWLREHRIDTQVLDATAPLSTATLSTATLPMVAGSAGSAGSAAREVRAIVVLGSYDSATDDSIAWIAAEREFLARANALEIPILGICFGAQQLTLLAGGTVTRMDSPERGWVETTGPAALGGSWFNWHQDEVSVPEHCQILSRSRRSVQAFAAGRHLGVQFHPEVAEKQVQDWLRDAQAAEGRLDVAGDPRVLLAETRNRAAAARAAAFRLYADFFHGAGLLATGPELPRTDPESSPRA